MEGARVTLSERDKLQVGMDRLFGAVAREAAATPTDVPAFRSLGHAFRVVTGRSPLEMSSHPIADAREAITAATWVNILGASMHRRLIKDYLAPAYGEEAICSVRPGGIPNFKNQETLRPEYFTDLDDVDPETADYVEIAPPGDEGVTYAVGQKGNLLSITRKVLLNDDLGAVTRMMGRLGRAARRTKAKYVWNFWINNATYGVDRTAWFTVGHGNLIATTLTADQTGAGHVLDAIIALGKMTEPGSGERLGLPELRSLLLWLVVPMDLMGIARQLNQSNTLPNPANVQVPNPIYHLFGPNDERVIVNSLLADATDWGVFRDPSEVDSIEIGFLNDQREPEFFAADIPTVGQTFIADKQQFKVRHEYGAAIVEFRGAVKSENP